MIHLGPDLSDGVKLRSVLWGEGVMLNCKYVFCEVDARIFVQLVSISQVLGIGKVPNREHVNEDSDCKKSYDLTVVSTLARVPPNLELEHVASNLLYVLLLVESSSRLHVKSGMLVVEERVVDGACDED